MRRYAKRPCNDWNKYVTNSTLDENNENNDSRK